MTSGNLFSVTLSSSQGCYKDKRRCYVGHLELLGRKMEYKCFRNNNNNRYISGNQSKMGPTRICSHSTLQSCCVLSLLPTRMGKVPICPSISSYVSGEKIILPEHGFQTPFLKAKTSKFWKHLQWGNGRGAFWLCCQRSRSALCFPQHNTAWQKKGFILCSCQFCSMSSEPLQNMPPLVFLRDLHWFV